MKKSRLILILMAVVLMLSACKGEGEKRSDKEATTSITLQMREIVSFNPLSVTHHSVRDILALCYEPLFEIDDSIETKGVLAQSIEISDDCMSAVINLKDSVLWHDGIKFTSSDVVYTINLLQENPSWGYYESVKYIASAEPIDVLSLRIMLTKPYGQIAGSLTFPIVSSHNAELDTKIIGTGAYMYLNYIPSTTMELISNKTWHGGDVACEKVNVSIIRDNSAVTTAFNTGIINAVTDSSFDTENSTPRINTKAHTYLSSEYEYIALNHKRGIFSSSTIRSAVSFAIDRDDIVKNCYQDTAVPVNAPIHPSAQNLTESTILSQYSLENANEMLFLEGYSLDENTRLLKNSSGNTLSFELLVNEENLSRVRAAELLSKQLFAVGINVRVESVSFEKYIEKIESEDFDAYLGGTRLHNFYDFDALFTEGGSLNNYGYKSEDMQLALTAINTSRGHDRVSDALFNFEEVFLREQPVLGIAFKNGILLTSENIKGNISPGINNPYKNFSQWQYKN